MRRFPLALVGMALLTAGPATAQLQDQFLIGDMPVEYEVTGLIDLRAASADAKENWADGGRGLLRFGSGDGDREVEADIADATLILDARLGFETSLFLQAQYEPDQHHPVDLVEGFLQYRPVSTSRWRPRIRAGVFFPPVSLEHESIGWTSPYTITPSAVNAWIGEEVRSTGVEGGLTYRLDADARVDTTLAAFVGNDPLGVLLTYRGWGVHDRKSGYFDDIAVPVQGRPRDLRPFLELDDNIGLHGGVTYADESWGEIGVFGYHNFADPRAARNGQGAWATKFANLGGRLFLPYEIEALGQIMAGTTEIFPDGQRDARIGVEFRAGYVMLSRPFGRDHRVSVRWDRFLLDDLNPGFAGRPPHDQEGNAFTAAYIYYPGDRHRLTFEVVYSEDQRPDRGQSGEPEQFDETLFQISYRYFF
ncbi:MAG: hypothetical protein NXI16_10860 [Alphaproteobacteria bacterium]|nr:hypothetical protein [Alphaproteobacteria bacterium]